MILVTPEDMPTEPGDFIALVEQELFEAAAEIEGLKKRVRSGEVDVGKDASRIVSDLKRFLVLATETKVKLDERKRRDAGIANDYALDLDAARSSICGRLARLRRRACPGCVSE